MRERGSGFFKTWRVLKKPPFFCCCCIEKKNPFSKIISDLSGEDEYEFGKKKWKFEFANFEEFGHEGD